MKYKNLFFKAFAVIGVVFFIAGVFAVNASAEETYSPYFMIATFDGSVDDAAVKVKDALSGGNFEVIGEYNPEGKPELKVIAYTRKDLQDVTLQVKDRGLLASVLKVGINNNNGKVDVSMLNPEYLFRGYLMKEFYNHEDALKKISEDAKNVLQPIGDELKPFGGKLKAKNLEHYHYKMGMEYFDDPVRLNTFESFEQGVETIRKNLAEKAGGAYEVFSIVREDEKTALFGIALGDEKKGEKNFLPKIGEHHLAALPYEIILSDTEATMLPGRFRIALHWPTLSMIFGKFSFAKIMSTPAAIEKMMKIVAK